MTKRQVKIDTFMKLALAAALLTIAGCADPARVVLYDERHGKAPAVRTTATAQRAAPPRKSSQPAAAVVRAPVERSQQSVPVVPASFHTVRSGDTVYSVSQRYQVPIRGLITMNGLQAPYVLRSGQTLRLPKPRRHIVRPGDTIFGISRTYAVAVSRLVQINDISPPYKIVVGRVLRLPDSVEPAATTKNAPVTKPPVSKPSTVVRRDRSEPAARVVAKKAPIAIPRPPPLSKGKFLLPVRGRLLSRFGPKGRGLRNDGVNIAAPRGTPVRAAESGIVVYSGNALLGFGNMVLVRHANGYMTAYAHNEAIAVSRGDTVRRGQVIAKVGSTGNVSKPQLHFEIRKGKRAINPSKFLPSLSAAS